MTSQDAAGQPPVADEEPCTSCWGTGWNGNMEEVCDCQPRESRAEAPPPAAQLPPDAAALAAAVEAAAAMRELPNPGEVDAVLALIAAARVLAKSEGIAGHYRGLLRVVAELVSDMKRAATQHAAELAEAEARGAEAMRKACIDRIMGGSFLHDKAPALMFAKEVTAALREIPTPGRGSSQPAAQVREAALREAAEACLSCVGALNNAGACHNAIQRLITPSKAHTHG